MIYLLLRGMNFKQLSRHFMDELGGIYDREECLSILNVVAAQVSGLSRPVLMMRQLDEVPRPELDLYLQHLADLREGKPVQYVLGSTVFYGLPFKVGPAVLIPRPETEELVEWIIEQVKSQPVKILDIGTGSGCIAVTLKKHLALSSVYALDVSAEAIEMAAGNAALNEVVVEFIFSDIRGYVSSEKFDVIVSNPPYITQHEKLDMHENVLAHEPHLALFVSNENPLLFYKAIADFALSNLNKDGLLFFEINEYLGQETVEMLSDKSFINIELKKDMQGKDRMIRCQLRG